MRHARRGRPGTTGPVVLALVLGLGAVATIGLIGTVAPPGPRTTTVHEVPAPAAAAPDDSVPTAAPDVAAPDPAVPVPLEPEPTPTPVPVDLTLVAAGDVLLHAPVVRSARTDDGTYDFTPLLAPVRPWVAGADLALCHLEVPVVAEGAAPSGFPRFGAPPQIARDLRANGWDGCSTASNHSLDQDLDGVVRTLDALEAAGLGHVGTARSAAEATRPQLYELDRAGRTVRVAHLSATYGTNGLPVPAAAPWAVELIDTDRLVEQAAQARRSGADLVLVSIHCCVEYVSEPTAEQLRIAETLGASGVVDLVIGHHAHVPQPVRLVPGGPDGAGMWVAYGLGNLVSNQDAACCTARTDSGLLLTATATVPPVGPVRVTGARWTAVTVDRSGGHRVHPLPSTRTGRPAGSLGSEDLRDRHERVRGVMGDDAPERVTPATPSGPPPRVLPRS